MSYNLFPSMRAIQLYERLTNTSFLELENNPDYILQFIYCCLISHPENEFHLTFNAAVTSFFPKYAESLVSEFTSQLEFVSQFKKPDSNDEGNTEGQETSSPEEKEPLFLSSLIPILVQECGLSIEFVMDRLLYTEIEMYINYNAMKKREDLEYQRFWTYLTIAPHIDSKKIKGPEDIIEFTWEKDEKKTKAEEKLKADRQRLIEVGIIKENK